jgi:hypothetical protein
MQAHGARALGAALRAVVLRRLHPDLHVYHFAPMEKTALGELAARYASRKEAVDDLFTIRCWST